MANPFTGGCACGAIRYSIAAEPVFMNHCQCRDCQRASGSGHGSYLTFSRRQAVTLSGGATLREVVCDSGSTKSNAFCSTCGSPVYLTFSAMPDLFTIHAASLDEPSRFRPQVITYTGRGQPWDRIDPSLPSFERMPPS
ncbi:GFA family protein [uncultured Alsobacter sp.]|uniref:GFA family protein n=1 Tax=uncultured Alsobacter sp. TaxID=1748258 RepID=UPI0025E85821|nr:GFA family protein [uncultured Alsobacter sp.]